MPVVLVDLDPGRGGIEVLLGIETRTGARWPDLVQVRGALGDGDLDGVLPRWNGVEVLSSDRRSTSLDGVTVGAVWAGLVASGRVVIADLPGRVLLANPALAQLAVGSALLLTSQDVIGVAGAVGLREAVGAQARLVLRRRPHARVAPLEAARLLDLQLLGMVPGDRRIAESTDRGFGPAVGAWSPLARSVRRLVRGLGHE